jgi:hypothetical protein
MRQCPWPLDLILFFNVFVPHGFFAEIIFSSVFLASGVCTLPNFHPRSIEYQTRFIPEGVDMVKINLVLKLK